MPTFLSGPDDWAVFDPVDGYMGTVPDRPVTAGYRAFLAREGYRLVRVRDVGKDATCLTPTPRGTLGAGEAAGPQGLPEGGS